MDAPITRNSAPRMVLTALLIGALAAGCSASGRPAQPTPTPIPQSQTIERPTYTVARGDIVEELRLSGRVSAVRQQDLGFPKAGRVLRLSARPGDKVRKGQLLAELEQRQLLGDLAQAQVALEQAQLVLRQGQDTQRFAEARAKLDLEEAQTVLRQARTEPERQLARIGVRRAQLAVEEARAITNEEAEKQVIQARLAHKRLLEEVETGRLYAPFAGEVSNVAIQPGASVEEFAPVLTVVDPGERELRVESATGADLNRLSAKQPVTVIFNRYEDRPVKGVVERLPQDANSTETQVRGDAAVHISYEANGLDLEIGDLATAVVTLQRKNNVLFLPPAALRTFQGRRFAVVQEGERQRRVDIEVGITGPGRIEIASGLKEGQVVVGQ